MSNVDTPARSRSGWAEGEGNGGGRERIRPDQVISDPEWEDEENKTRKVMLVRQTQQSDARSVDDVPVPSPVPQTIFIG